MITNFLNLILGALPAGSSGYSVPPGTLPSGS